MASSRMFPLSAGLACCGRCRWSLAVAEELVSGGPGNLLAGAAGMARDRACRPAAGGPGAGAGSGKLLEISLPPPCPEVVAIVTGRSPRRTGPGDTGRWAGVGAVGAPARAARARG